MSPPTEIPATLGRARAWMLPAQPTARAKAKKHAHTKCNMINNEQSLEIVGGVREDLCSTALFIVLPQSEIDLFAVFAYEAAHAFSQAVDPPAVEDGAVAVLHAPLAGV